MEKSNEEVTKKENKVKKFLKKNWAYLAGAGVIVVGGTVLGIKVKKGISKCDRDGEDIIAKLTGNDDWGAVCLKQMIDRDVDIPGTPESIDSDIFLKIAPALEEAVLNGGDKTINLYTSYDLGDMHHRCIDITVDSVFGD